MVSFEIVLFAIRVPIKKTKDLLRQYFEEYILGLFPHVLITSYFSFSGQFYEQTDGVAISSPVSPVIANFYLEDYKNAALEWALPKPRCLFHYMDDTFVIRPHRPNKQKDFLHYPNSIHHFIQFTMETQSGGHLSSWI
jgi:retron-type reverse transcriptase